MLKKLINLFIPRSVRLNRINKKRPKPFDIALLSKQSSGWICIGKRDPSHYEGTVEEEIVSLEKWGKHCYPKSELKVVKMEKP